MEEINQNGIAPIICDQIKLDNITQLQSYGVLLVINRKELTIIQHSENTGALLKVSVSKFHDNDITHFLSGIYNTNNVHAWLSDSTKKYKKFLWNGDHEKFPVWVYIHQHNGFILLEIELAEYDEDLAQDSSFIEEFFNLNIDTTLIQMEVISKQICAHIREITGTDRVSLYQFLNDGSGVTIGESINEGMDSYLGLHFPKTDVPYFVREMYLRQPMRYIPSIEEAPVSLVSTPQNTKCSLDLSDVMLRAVASVHIEYLRNMGVTSALSIAIIHHNKLWGLLSCQHKTQMILPIYNRFKLLFIAKHITKQLIAIDDNANTLEKNRMLEIQNKIQESIFNAKNIFIAFEQTKDHIIKMFNSDGIAYSFDKKILISGGAPNEEQITDLIDWLYQNHHSKIVMMHALSTEYPAGDEISKIASGIAAIPLGHDKKNYIILFRREIISELDWAGNPNDALTQHGSEYSPRNSFKAWRETISNQAHEWKSFEIEAAKTLQSMIESKLLQITLTEYETMRQMTTILHDAQAKLEKQVIERTAELTKKNAELTDTLDQLNTMKDQLIYSEKMAMIGQLAAGIAHEINNPLSYIMSNVSLLHEYSNPLKNMINYYNELIAELNNDTTYKKSELYESIISFTRKNKISSIIKNLEDLTSESNEGLQRIKKIISNLVTFSQIAPEVAESVDVNAVINSAIEITSNELKYKCVVIKKLTDLPMITASYKQLELVFVNFLLNAGQSITKNGEITISSTVSDGTILISIEDNGCGISPEIIANIFNPFFTTKPANNNTGLGLSTNYGIIKALGGHIAVKSEIEHGSTFTVSLPIDQSAL